MNLEENFKSSIKTLKGNKARSFLTMLGIVIGIASVITMSAIGKGGQENITGNLKKQDMENLLSMLTEKTRLLDGNIFLMTTLLKN